MHCDFDLWTPKINSVHPWLMGSLHVKFHDDMCKGKAIMRHKQFPIINALWPWPFDPKINRAHSRLMGSLCAKFHDDGCKGKAVMKFHDDRCKGKVVMRTEPFYLTVRPNVPLCFAGDTNIFYHFCLPVIWHEKGRRNGPPVLWWTWSPPLQ